MDPPASDVKLAPESVKDAREGGPVLSCNLCDFVLVHKIVQALLPALATACVDNTTGDMFRGPGSVASDIRKEMVNYLTQRSESFVAESVVLEGGPEAEASDHPYDIIASFTDEFAGTKRNLFSRVSGWLLSDKREDKIDDFAQEMEINGFWPVDKREEIIQNMLKNVDFKNAYHCDVKFESVGELASHVSTCSYRPMNCENEGCDDTFSANQAEKHDSVCPFKIIPCEQNCSNSIMRREMDRHCITVCPMKLVNCPFYALGCQLAIPQCKIEEHRTMDLNSHLLYIIIGIHKEAPVEDLKQRVEQLEKLSSGNLAECRDVRSLISKVKDLDAKLGALVGAANNKTDEEAIEAVAKVESLEVGDTNKDTEKATETEIMDSGTKPESFEVNPGKDGEETETKDSEAKPGSSEANPNKDGEEARKTDIEDSEAKPESPEVNPDNESEEASKSEVNGSEANIEESLKDEEAKSLSSEASATNKDGEETAGTTVDDSEAMPTPSNNVN